MFEVNQKVWFVPSIYSHVKNPYEVTVERIGKKWITLSNGFRCDKFGEVDGNGYCSPGTLYPNHEAYSQEKAKENVWKMIKNQIQYNYQVPDNLTIQDLVEIAGKLGINTTKV